MVNDKKKFSKSKEYIDVETELVDDFERVNFGARSLESVEQDLAHGSEEMMLAEERKTKIIGKKSMDKNLERRMQVSHEKTAEKLNEKIRTTLPHHSPFLHAPTGRHK